MEDINCNLCGSKNTYLIFRIKNRYSPMEEILNIVRCGKCGLIYLNLHLKLEDLKGYYPREYFFCLSLEEIDKRDKDRLDVKCRNRLREISEFVKTGILLDVGCGDGYFLSYAKQVGWQVKGVEISEFAAQRIKEKFGIDVFCGELLKAGYPDEYFDVVSLFEVLEHLYNPVETLLEVKRILKKEGLLIMTVPNFDSFQKLLFGKYWHIIDPPRHLYYFSKSTISNILKKCNLNLFTIKAIGGFRVLDTKITTGYSESIRVILRDSFLNAKVNRFKGTLFNLKVRRQTFFKEFLHKLETVIFILPALEENLFLKGDTLLIKATK